MQKLGTPLWKRFFLGGLLALLHCALVIAVLVAIKTSSDPEAWMALAIFDYVDHPVLPLSGLSPSLFITGAILWFCYGCVLQNLIFIRRSGNPLRLAVSLLLIGALSMIPHFELAMKPRWEAAWDRAWALGRGPGTDSDKAIKYVSEAIHYSPKDNKELPVLWGLSREPLYRPGKLSSRGGRFPEAGWPLRKHNRIPNPKDLLGAYTIRWISFTPSREISKAARNVCEKSLSSPASSMAVIPFRKPRRGNRWPKLTHDAGAPKDGAEMLQRAVTLYSAQHVDYVPYDYLNRTVKKWKTE